MGRYVKFRLTTAGSSTGPFDLFSDVDGYTSAFATSVTTANLTSDYYSDSVPDLTKVVRIKSNSTNCTNYIDVRMPATCSRFRVTNKSAFDVNFDYLSCASESIFVSLTSGSYLDICALYAPNADPYYMSASYTGEGFC